MKTFLKLMVTGLILTYILVCLSSCSPKVSKCPTYAMTETKQDSIAYEKQTVNISLFAAAVFVGFVASVKDK